MASDLRWSVKAFREAFQEVFLQGMAKASWDVGVVVLKRALFDSSGEPRETAKPQSPNVVRSWATSWELVPDCELSREYLMTLKAFADALGKGFREAFADAFRKALSKEWPHPSPIQDQESGLRNQDSGSPPKAPQGASDKSVSLTGSNRGRQSDMTEQERESAIRVLTRLSDLGPVRYQNSRAHLTLIVARLREEITELELRCVVAHCANKWAADEKMREYLRPETLFGPRSIHKYLDAARTEFAAEIDAARPLLALVTEKK